MKRKFHHFFSNYLNNQIDDDINDETAPLIRVLCLLFALYYLFMSIMLALIGHYFLSITALFILIPLAGSFITTYENKTELGVKILLGSILFISCELTLFVGWEYTFINLAMATILIVFYTFPLKFRTKIIYSLFLAILFISIGIGYEYMPVNPPILPLYKNILKTANIMITIIFTTYVSYFYSKKYRDSEEKLIKYNQKLMKLISIDPLTGLWNRRTMQARLMELQHIKTKQNEDFTIAIIDIDAFKKVNDSYGHDAGDYLLTVLARIFTDYMENKGSVARWGGEEFLLSFEKTTFKTALTNMDNLHSLIEQYPFKYKGKNINLTISAGLKEFEEHLGVDTVISMADKLLHQSKNNGKNSISY